MRSTSHSGGLAFLAQDDRTQLLMFTRKLTVFVFYAFPLVENNPLAFNHIQLTACDLSHQFRGFSPV
jgi:hypothetical protein